MFWAKFVLILMFLIFYLIIIYCFNVCRELFRGGSHTPLSVKLPCQPTHSGPSGAGPRRPRVPLKILNLRFAKLDSSIPNVTECS